MAIGGGGDGGGPGPLGFAIAEVALVAGGALIYFSGLTAAPAVAQAFGATLFSTGAGIVATGVAEAVSSPEPASAIARQLKMSIDAEAPREIVYGTVVKSGTLVWTGITGNKDEWTGWDFVIADHATSELRAMQFDDVTFELTDTYNEGANEAIRNDDAPVFTDFWPGEWYIPMDGSWWDRTDVTLSSTTKKIKHFGFRPYLGTQTATDAFMETTFGGAIGTTDNSSPYIRTTEERKFIGLSVIHGMTRSHPGLRTMDRIPTLLVWLNGALLEDYRDSSTAFSRNCALVLYDYAKRKFGISQVVDSDQAADDCDDTAWDTVSPPLPRYEWNGVIRDDEDPLEVMDDIASHMGGGWTMRGEQIKIWAAGSKTVDADAIFTPDDYGDGALQIIPAPLDRWFNTISPHYVQNGATDGDDSVLHGKLHPANRVTKAEWVTEDGGRTIMADRRYRGARTGRHAKYLAWLELQWGRLEQGATCEVTLKSKALVVEKGDLFRIENDEQLSGPADFLCVGKDVDPQTFQVRLRGRYWDNAILTPGASITDDVVGQPSKRRSPVIEPITGVTARVADSLLGPDGLVKSMIELRWNDPGNSLVSAGGSIEIAWKKSATSTWLGAEGTIVPGSLVTALLPKPFSHGPWDFRVKAISVYGAHGDWSETATVLAPKQVSLPQPPADPSIEAAIHNDGRFDRSTPEQGFSPNWIETSLAIGAATIIEDPDFSRGKTDSVLQLDAPAQKSNRIAYAWDLTQWTQASGIVTTLVSEPTLRADIQAAVLDDQSTTQACLVYLAATIDSGQQYALSVFVAKDRFSSHLLEIGINQRNVWLNVDPNAGTGTLWSGSSSPDSWQVEDWSEDFWRVEVVDTSAETTWQIRIYAAVTTTESPAGYTPAAIGTTTIGLVDLQVAPFVLPIITNGSPETYDSAVIRWADPVRVDPGTFLRFQVVARSQNVGPAYDAGEHDLRVDAFWYDGDGNRVASTDDGGPLRDEEVRIAQIGPQSQGDTSWFDPGAHGTEQVVFKTIQVPARYGIRTLQLRCRALNVAQATRWWVSALVVNPTNEFPGPTNWSKQVATGAASKANRSGDATASPIVVGTYRSMVGFRIVQGSDLSFARFHVPPTGQQIYVWIRGSVRIDASNIAASPTGVLTAYGRIISLFETNEGIINPIGLTGTTPENIVDTTSPPDGVLDDWEYRLGQAFYGEIEERVEFSFVAPMSLTALPVIDTSPPTYDPPQRDRLVFRPQMTTNHPDGIVEVHNVSVSAILADIKPPGL